MSSIHPLGGSPYPCDNPKSRPVDSLPPYWCEDCGEVIARDQVEWDPTLGLVHATDELVAGCGFAAEPRFHEVYERATTHRLCGVPWRTEER